MSTAHLQAAPTQLSGGTIGVAVHIQQRLPTAVGVEVLCKGFEPARLPSEEVERCGRGYDDMGVRATLAAFFPLGNGIVCPLRSTSRQTVPACRVFIPLLGRGHATNFVTERTSCAGAWNPTLEHDVLPQVARSLNAESPW